MKRILLAAVAAGLSLPVVPQAAAGSKHDGACVGFAGSTGGQNYAGLKCKVDEMPGDWVIRHTVKERDNREEYRQLLKLPKRPIPCTLKKVSELAYNGVNNVMWEITSCR